MISCSESFYLFRDDGLDGPYSPVELRLMLDQGLVNRQNYCQPEDGGPTRTLREIFDDPEAFAATGRISSDSSLHSMRNLDLDPFASGDVPMMGDTLPIQANAEEFDLEPEDAHTDTPYQGESDLPEPNISITPAPVYHGHPSFLSYSRSLIVACLFGIAAVLTLPLAPLAPTICASIALLIIIYVWADRSFADYIVTQKRVEVVTGLLSRSSQEVKISDIRSINVVKDGFLGFLGVGNVEFASAGGDDIEVRFLNITGTQRVKKAVRKLQDA